MRYPIGIRVTGKVLTMRSSGTVVELEEGLEGMIQESDMFWIDVFNHPSELLNEGDDVSAVVLDVDPDNQRIRLGLEQTSEERWCTIASRLKIGQIVTGKVTKLMSCGVVVMIAEGVGGLVHRSEICDQQINRAKDVLQLGQEVQVCIVRIDSANRSITLSILAVNTSGDEFERKHSKRNCFEPIVRADMPAHNSGEHE